MATTFGEKVRAVFTENLNLKFISFGFALVLYTLVHGTQEAQRVIAVDLIVLLPDDSYNRVLVSQVPPTVHITLRGSRAALDELHSDDIGNLQLDVHSGVEKRVTLDPRAIHVPPGVRVEQVDPPAIDLSWEDRIARDVPLQVGIVGTPLAGFVVKGVPVPDPKQVRARGPRSEVVLLEHGRAEPFDVAGLGEGVHTRVLEIDKPKARVAFDVDKVRATVEIGREIGERPFMKVPVAVVGIPKGRTLPQEVDVRLLCPPEVLRGLRPEQVIARVDVKSTAPTGSLALPVEVTVEKCEAHVTPSTVVVRW